jgi:anaerobic ribonucleoside-triphosphate reductase
MLSILQAEYSLKNLDKKGVITMDKKKRVKCDVYAKVVGYCRKVSNWNEGKKQEFKDRNFVNIK